MAPVPVASTKKNVAQETGCIVAVAGRGVSLGNQSDGGARCCGQTRVGGRRPLWAGKLTPRDDGASSSPAAGFESTGFASALAGSGFASGAALKSLSLRPLTLPPRARHSAGA